MLNKGLEIRLEYRDNSTVLASRYFFPLETMRQLYYGEEDEQNIARVARYLYQDIMRELKNAENSAN